MEVVSRLKEMHLNLAALHNVKFTCIEVLMRVRLCKGRTRHAKTEKGQGVGWRPESVCAYMCICPALFAEVCVCVCVCLLTGLSQGECVVSLSETSGFAGCVWGL